MPGPRTWTGWRGKARVACCTRSPMVSRQEAISRICPSSVTPRRSTCTGRGPLEAISMGVDLAPTDIAYRCNIVTVRDETMADFSAGHISSAEGAALFESLAPKVPEVVVKAGVSYRNLLVVPGGSAADTTPPHDIVGQPIAGYLPRNGDADLLLSCMEKSREVFSGHPVNVARVKAGKPPATQIWPWSGGRRPAFPLFSQKYNRTGGMISAVDLLNGIARYAKMEIIKVPGATGYLDTDYMAKARYALDAIKRLDFVYVHIEAPDEAGHLGSVEEKVRAIENVDRVVGAIREKFDGIVAVLPDHPTPIRIKTHSREPVPFVVTGKGTDKMHALLRERSTIRDVRNKRGDRIPVIPIQLNFYRLMRHQSPASSRFQWG